MCSSFLWTEIAHFGEKHMGCRYGSVSKRLAMKARVSEFKSPVFTKKLNVCLWPQNRGTEKILGTCWAASLSLATTVSFRVRERICLKNKMGVYTGSHPTSNSSLWTTPTLSLTHTPHQEMKETYKAQEVKKSLRISFRKLLKLKRFTGPLKIMWEITIPGQSSCLQRVQGSPGMQLLWYVTTAETDVSMVPLLFSLVGSCKSSQ